MGYMDNLIKSASGSSRKRAGRVSSGQRPLRKQPERVGNDNAKKMKVFSQIMIATGIATYFILDYFGVFAKVSIWLYAPLGFVFGCLCVGLYIYSEILRHAAEDARNRATPRGRQGKAPDPELQFHQFMVQLVKEQLTKLLTRARGWKK